MNKSWNFNPWLHTSDNNSTLPIQSMKFHCIVHRNWNSFFFRNGRDVHCDYPHQFHMPVLLVFLSAMWSSQKVYPSSLVSLLRSSFCHWNTTKTLVIHWWLGKVFLKRNQPHWPLHSCKEEIHLFSQLEFLSVGTLVVVVRKFFAIRKISECIIIFHWKDTLIFH